MRNARDKSSEVGKLSRAFSRSVESSDWLFVYLQISCLKSGDYHVDFSRSVSERLAWIGSPTPNLSPDLSIVTLSFVNRKYATALRFLVRNRYTRIGSIKANGHPRVFARMARWQLTLFPLGVFFSF